MPFRSELKQVYDRTIAPALEERGLRPVRTDRELPIGNVIAAIRQGIRQCYFAIVDTTGDRRNVMYEFGLAHADDKPVVILRQQGADGEIAEPPFDFSTESIIGYTNDETGLVSLRQRIGDAISIIRGR